MLWPQWYSSPAAQRRVMLYSKNKATWCKVCSVFRPHFLPLCVSGQPRSAKKELVLQIFSVIFQAGWTGNARSWLTEVQGWDPGAETHVSLPRYQNKVPCCCSVCSVFVLYFLLSLILHKSEVSYEPPPFCFFCCFFPLTGGFSAHV